MKRWLATLALGVVLTPATVAAQQCSDGNVTVSADFPAAAMASCEFTAKGSVRILISPESESINPSPWYAVSVTAKEAVNLQLTLDYGDFKHRYQPDVARGDGPWQTLSEEAVVVTNDEHTASWSVDVTPDEITYIAAQPLMAVESYRAWFESLPQQTVEIARIGDSTGGEPLWRLNTAPRPQTLLILGRQHPPETTGAEAMKFFLERLFADDPMARGFRSRVGILAYPLLNPDGVQAGHWRHNLGHTDLNRDWGPFTQTETRTVFTDIERYLETHSTQLMKSLDFHSTHYEVFYTQEDDTAVVMPALLPAWLDDFENTMKQQMPSFELNRRPSNNPERPTAKSFFNKTYGIASTTFEMADSSDREFIRRYAITAAESLMRTWPAPE
jgi:hypothetical protein